MQIQWSEDYDLGVEIIDAQHRMLFEIAANLTNKNATDRGHEVVGTILCQLADYVGYHFCYEEEVMRQLNFPGLEEHKIQHEILILRLGRLIYEFEQGKEGIVEETVRFVNEWITRHILIDDREIAAHARLRRRRPPTALERVQPSRPR